MTEHKVNEEVELRILRKLFKRHISQGRLMSANEFNRHVTNLAKELGENTDDLRQLAEKFLTEIVGDMLTQSLKKSVTSQIPEVEHFGSSVK